MLNVGSEQKILNLISSCISQPAARPAQGRKHRKQTVESSAPEFLVPRLGSIQSVQQMSVLIFFLIFIFWILFYTAGSY